MEPKEVVQTGIADDGDEGLYCLVSYDCPAKESSDKVLDELEKRISERIHELKRFENAMPENRCQYLKLIAENRAMWAQIKELRAEREQKK